MAFNSAAIEEFKDIWVFCEQRDGKLMNTDFELISEGRKLADERGSKLVGILLGDNVQGIAKELGGYGADKVIVCEDPALKVYTTDAYTKVICDVAMEKKPGVILIGASNIGRDLGPRCAARMHTGLTADCTHLDIDMDGYLNYLKEGSTIDVDSVKWNMEDINLKMTRPAFGGHLMATIICPRFRPCMSTVRPGVMRRLLSIRLRLTLARSKSSSPPCLRPTFRQGSGSGQGAKELVDLIGADVTFPGRGINKDPEKGIELAKQLADAFGGGVVGSSRALVDAGLITADHQVGQTVRLCIPRCMWLWVSLAPFSTRLVCRIPS
ncbi:MAG: electron transfer flavoprotein subunit alpha/FixB family protein [Blautia massiliensis (ex Durand et al. 2017)]